MKGLLSLMFLLPLLVLGSPASAQQPTREPLASGADYATYAERLIERTRREKPEIASRAEELYKRLPAIVDQLEKEARAAGHSALPRLEMGSSQLDAAMERWIGDKGAAIDTEIRFAAGRLRTVQLALEPVKALVEERQRKQQIIASVILLIRNILAGEDGSSEEPEAERNKSDRVGPSASSKPRGDLLQAAPGTAALSMD